MTAHIPFWTDQFPCPADLSEVTDLPASVDVAIVGSGYTGLSAARVLATSGAEVAVLERHSIGYGASSRNGGMATPGIKQALPVIVKRYGLALGRQFWQASLDAIDLIDQLVTDEDIECDWQRNGSVRLAYKPSHFRHMVQQVAWYRDEFGYTLTPVTPADIRSEIGTDSFHGGLVDTYGGGLQPAKFIFGLARAVARRGVHLCPNSDVRQITRLGSGFEIHTNRGTLHAREVLVATNGYTDSLVPKLQPRVFPVGSYIIVTEPLSEPLQRQLSPKGRMYFDSKNFLNYFRLTADGRMLWGGRNNLSTDLDLGTSAGILRQQMVAVFPELADVPITHSWTGRLGLTFDLMPHIGRIEGIHYALGYCGHGLSIATYLGAEIGELLTGQKATSPFAEIPHPTQVFYHRKPWFLPLAALYYRVRDWLS